MYVQGWTLPSGRLWVLGDRLPPSPRFFMPAFSPGPSPSPPHGPPLSGPTLPPPPGTDRPESSCGLAPWSYARSPPETQPHELGYIHPRFKRCPADVPKLILAEPKKKPLRFSLTVFHVPPFVQSLAEHVNSFFLSPRSLLSQGFAGSPACSMPATPPSETFSIDTPSAKE